jgi:predicted nucleotide-binding protein (sugar kinase/HSP70/actin superfamily)
MEWIYYTNFTRMRYLRAVKDYWQFAQNLIQDKVQVLIEHRLAKPFHGVIEYLEETPTRGVLDYALPYIHDSFEGEAALSVGKSIDYYQHGVCGVINAMPFGCMPGTIVTALLKKVREDYENLPIISLAYDGTQHAGTDTRLEAFIHQAKQYMKMKKR